MGDDHLSALAVLLAGLATPEGHQAWVTQRVDAAFPLNPPPAWSPVQAALWRDALAALKPSETVRSLWSRFVRRLRGLAVGEAPAEVPVLLPGVIVSALQGPELCFQVARRIHHHAAGRVILHPDPGPPPVLAVQTWWLLLDLMPLPAKQAPAWADITGGVGALAATAAAGGGWAGFWDLYVLRQARQAAPAQVVAWDAAWLEYLDGGAALLSGRDDADAPPPPAPVAPAWRQAAPGYAAALLDGRL